MITKAILYLIIGAIKFNNYRFHIDNLGDGWYLQVQFMAPDNDVPALLTWQSGRKWYISPHMTKSEIVLTALKAVLTSVEHEAREQFTYHGKAIFGPHVNVEALLDLADDTVYREKVA